MIDRKQLDSHPANRLAVELLRPFRAAPDGIQTPLLTLVQVYLNNLPPQAQRQGYTADLLQMAYELNSQEQDWVASLFVEDREQLQQEVEQVPRGQEWPVLKEHLDSLYQAMRAAEKESASGRGTRIMDSQAVGNLLAQNLFNNLQAVFPNFGPQSR